jgi:hypothetical protein
LDLRAGYSALHDFGDTSSGTLLGVQLVHRLSPRSLLTLNAGTSLGDSADAFRRDQGIRAAAIDDRLTLVSADPFRADFATLDLDLARERSSLRIGADWRKERHERELEFDRERISGSISWTRRIRPTVSIIVSGIYGTEDFPNADVSSDEWSAGAGIDWQLAGAYVLSLRGDRFNGTGDSSAVIGLYNYVENRISLRLSYSPRR